MWLVWLLLLWVLPALIVGAILVPMIVSGKREERLAKRRNDDSQRRPKEQ